MKDFKIIDFHTHPFGNNDYNICTYRNDVAVNSEMTRDYMAGLGVSHICGSVVYNARRAHMTWEEVAHLNGEALKLADSWKGFYVPGFHIHPDYPKESIAEMKRMHGLGVNLIGELVPYFCGWSEDYDTKGLDEILDCALELNMIFNFHTMNEDAIDRMVEKHPKNIFVAAHPGEADSVARHFQRMEKCESYYLDLSGTGIFRMGMLACGVKKFDAERFIFGSDFPVCNTAVYVGGVGMDSLLTDNDKEKIFFENADRLLRQTNNKFYEF